MAPLLDSMVAHSALASDFFNTIGQTEPPSFLGGTAELTSIADADKTWLPSMVRPRLCRRRVLPRLYVLSPLASAAAVTTRRARLPSRRPRTVLPRPDHRPGRTKTRRCRDKSST